MAIGTVTLVDKSVREGSVQMVRVTIVGPSSYTAGGDTGLAAALAALSGINSNLVPYFVAGQNDVTGYVVQYNKTTDKLIFLFGNYDASDGPLIEASGNLSGVTVDVWLACW